MSSDKVQIRPAQPVDWSRIQEIFRAAGQAAWGHILAPDALEELSLSDMWREFMEAPDPHAAFLVGSQNESTNGFVAYRPFEESPQMAEIALLYVHPKVWGSGLAGVLLSEAESRLRTLGYQEATLFTEERNERPRAFYEKEGWSLDGEIRERTFKGADLREVRYAKSLTQ